MVIGPYVETGISEMTVESENPFDSVPSHQNEGSAVCKADLLVCVFVEELYCLELVFM
jgi:hypothetical protein